jgi:EmrB/QacA subfamily drug resistance transporter
MSRSWTIAAAAVAAALAFIDTTALTVALPALKKDLSASDTQILWIHNGYAIPLAALLLLGGALGDGHGVRRVFMLGLVMFAASSAGCGLAPSIEWLIALRVVQGMSAAVMIPGSLALIARAFPKEELGRAVGLWSAFTIVATALGPVLGGLLASQDLWRGIFFINLPAAAIAVVISALRIPRDPPASGIWPDAVSSLLLAAGLGTLSAALIEQVPWLVPLAIVLLVVFVGRQRSSENPLVPPELYQSRTLIRATMVSLLIYAAWGGFIYLLPSFLILSLGFSPPVAGLLQLPPIILLALMSPLAGKMLDRHGPRRPLSLGAAISALGFFVLPCLGTPARPLLVVLPLGLLGVGLGLCAAPLSATIIKAVPPSRQGLAAGLNSTTVRIATAVGVALLGFVAFRAADLQFADRFRALCIAATGLGLLASGVSLGFEKPSNASFTARP